MSEYRVVGQEEIDIDEQELVDLEAEPGVEDATIADEDFGFTPEQEAVLEEIEGSPLLAAEDAADLAKSEAPAFEKRSTGFEWALEQIIEVNQRAIEEKKRWKDAVAVAKDLKEEYDGTQEELNRLILEAAKLKSQSEPDPEKFPLFDKQRVDGMFPKPDAIAPLPAEDFAEHYRRMARDTRLDSLLISKRTVKAMEKAGYQTVADIGKLTDASAPLTSVSGIGFAASDEIIEALARVGDAWKAEWDALHPEESPAEGETETPAEEEN